MKAEMFTGSKEWLALQTPESSSFASLGQKWTNLALQMLQARIIINNY